MSTPLWLTADEQTVFAAFSPELRDGWEVQEETQTFADTSDRRAARLGLVRLHDPALLALRDKAKEASSPEALAALLAEMDVHDVSEDDLAELFFALGPDALTGLVVPLLREAKTDGDLDDVASLLLIRHSLLASFSF